MATEYDSRRISSRKERKSASRELEFRNIDSNEIRLKYFSFSVKRDSFLSVSRSLCCQKFCCFALFLNLRVGCESWADHYSELFAVKVITESMIFDEAAATPSTLQPC